VITVIDADFRFTEASAGKNGAGRSAAHELKMSAPINKRRPNRSALVRNHGAVRGSVNGLERATVSKTQHQARRRRGRKRSRARAVKTERLAGGRNREKALADSDEQYGMAPSQAAVPIDAER